MKLLTSVALLLISVLAASAQQAGPVPYSAKTLNDLRTIQRAALKSDYALNQTAYLSNNIGPRMSGSPQAQRAVEYVADEMRRLGLEVRLQKVMVPHWVRGVETGELTEFPGMAKGTTQKIVLTALGGSVPTPASGLTAEVVVVNNFAELEALGRKGVEGKIVLFNNKFDSELADSGFGLQAYGMAVAYRGGGASAAARFGAVAALVRSAGASQNRLAHTGAMRYDPKVAKIPSAAVTYEDADLMAYLARMGTVTIRVVLTPQTLPDTVGYNVIADLKGSERPDEIVIVSGHLDSWDLGTGAIDDACGVAVAMQVPFLLKQLELHPKRTIRVVAWMDEELGGTGGAAYALEEAANVAKHVATVESDLGASHPIGILYSAKPEMARFLAPISDVLRSQGAPLAESRPGGVGSDTGELSQQGVPSFAPYFNTRTYFKYHHTAADTFDKIDPKELAEVGSLTAVLTYALADSQQPLPR